MPPKTTKPTQSALAILNAISEVNQRVDYQTSGVSRVFNAVVELKALCKNAAASPGDLEAVLKRVLKATVDDSLRNQFDQLTTQLKEFAKEALRTLHKERSAAFTAEQQRRAAESAAVQAQFDNSLEEIKKQLGEIQSFVRSIAPGQSSPSRDASLRFGPSLERAELQARYNKSRNVIVHGIPTDFDESSLEAKLVNMVKQRTGYNIPSGSIVAVVRLGKVGAVRRPVKVEFNSQHVRDEVFGLRWKLSQVEEQADENKYYMDPDLTHMQLQHKHNIFPLFKSLRAAATVGKRPYFVDEVLYYYPTALSRRAVAHPANFDDKALEQALQPLQQ